MTAALIRKSDFDLICRTCLVKKSNMTSVHTRQLVKMIHSFSKIKIRKNDNLPTLICDECESFIKRTFAFKVKCESSDKLLRRVLKSGEDVRIDSVRDPMPELPVKVKYEPTDLKTEDANDVDVGYSAITGRSEVEIDEPADRPEIDEPADRPEIDEPAGRPEIDEPAGRPEIDEPAGRPEIDEPAGRPEIDEPAGRPEIDDGTRVSRDTTESEVYPDSERDVRSDGEGTADTVRDGIDGPSVTSVRVERAKLMGLDKCDPMTLTCKICDKVLVNIYSLGRHMEMHDENRKFRHSCVICRKGFYEKGQLTKHLRRHRGETRYACEMCAKAFYELSALAVHMKKHDVEPMRCDVCGKPFYVRLQLEIHAKTHSTEKEHVCGRCGKAFAKAKQLRKHGLAHVEERTYACTSCDKAFKDEYNLRIHARRVHVDRPKLDVCNVCGKAVKHIKHHMLRHSGEKPHACVHCPRAFACKSQLRNHCRAKHGDGAGDLAAYTVLCAACGKRCQSTTELRVHMRKHTGERPYSCHLCDKRYKTGYLLTAHVRSHTGERPYVCTVCHKGFYTNQILKHHARIHTGERPYSCRVCGRAFTQNSALRTHMKIH